MTRRPEPATDCLSPSDSLTHCSTPLGVLAALIAIISCSDDEDAFVRQATLNRGGSSGASTASGIAGTGNSAGSAGTNAAGGALGNVAIDAGAPVDRNVFRPEEVPATAQLMARLRVPDGFTVRAFAEDVGQARMLVARGDQLYVTRPDPGDVLRLTDTDGDGNADERTTVATSLPLVHGIAFRGDQVYLATDKQVLLASVADDGSFGTPAVIIDDLPDGGQHPRRTLGISPDDRLFISIGSSCDACEESNDEHATMLVAALDGSSRTTFASGLRNTIGFAWHPTTRQLWGMDHGSDWRGDDIPPEELNSIELGADYGWPYCYGDRRIDPVIQDPPQGTKEQYCATTRGPVLSTQAHNAPIAFTFYTAASFPAEYQGDAFIAMRGSWNRLPPTGYKIVRLMFDDQGVPQRFEDFVTGFLSDDGASTFGRPAGITMAPDGALLFSDDTSGVIYRVSHGAADAGAPTRPEPDPTVPPLVIPPQSDVIPPDAGADAG